MPDRTATGARLDGRQCAWFGLRWLCVSLILLVSTLLTNSTPANAAEPEQTLVGHVLAKGVTGSLSLIDGGETAILVMYGYDELDKYPRIYRVPLDGSEPPRRLSGDLIGIAPVLSPDGQTIVFCGAGRDNPINGMALYSAPVSGGSPSRLLPSASLPCLYDARFTPDSQYVIASIDIQNDPQRSGLIRIPVNGGESLRLAPAYPVITGWMLMPDGAHVLYVENQRVLYRVAITGGLPTKLFEVDEATAIIGAFRISPDSTRVVLSTNQRASDLFELYSIPVSGGEVIPISYPLSLSDLAAPDEFVVTPDNAFVLLRTKRTLAYPAELYRVPIDGGEPTALAPPSTHEQLDGAPLANFLSEDGSRLLYAAWDADTDERNLYITKIDDATTVQINVTDSGENIPLDSDISISNAGRPPYRLSPDGSRVAFLADSETEEYSELYLATVGDGAPFKIDMEGLKSIALFSTDGSRFAFHFGTDFSEIENSRRWLCMIQVDDYVDGGTPRCSRGIPAPIVFGCGISGVAAAELSCIPAIPPSIQSHMFLPNGQLLYAKGTGLYVSMDATFDRAAYFPAVWSNRLPPAGNLLDVLRAADQFDTFLEALAAAKLDDLLTHDGPYTVLAPTDAAFARLPAESVDQLLASPSSQLAQYLRSYILPIRGGYRASQIANGMSVIFPQHPEIHFEVTAGIIRANGALIVYPDLEATNGIVHGVNDLILPLP